MKYNLFIFILILIPIFFGSCSQKERDIHELEALVEDMEAEHETYTAEDWRKAAQEYADLEKNMQKYEYTDEELQEIGRLKGQCAAYLAKQGLKVTKDALHDYMQEVDGAVEGFLDALE